MKLLSSLREWIDDLQMTLILNQAYKSVIERNAGMRRINALKDVGYTDPVTVHGELWMIPPGGVMPVPAPDLDINA